MATTTKTAAPSTTREPVPLTNETFPQLQQHTSIPRSFWIVVWSVVLLFRVAVGYQPHSGQDNYHGAAGAYGGDFEAQRHWMELTWQLPVGDWYYWDLEYWGLDYPPLTAYQSWVCGALSHYLVGPSSVALGTSRGWEDPTHKALLRATVVVLDLLIYGSAVFFLSRAVAGSSTQHAHTNQHTPASMVLFVTAMTQPALVLIDHGHFQYNTVALGLALWAFFHCTRVHADRIDAKIRHQGMVASVFFVAALSFKQMTLYYAPAIFAYLLGQCCCGANGTNLYRTFWSRFWSFGITVLITVALLWWPFVYYEPSTEALQSNTEYFTRLDVTLPTTTTPLSRFGHVLHRILPLQRGLFEHKVANVWCALSVHPLRLRQRLPASLQPLAAFGLTFLLILPACYRLFQLGQFTIRDVAKQEPTKSPGDKHEAILENEKSLSSAARLRILLWGATSCALGFFLASFQVHEKSILLALAPASLLGNWDAWFVDWFAIVATYTLWPLMCLDRLQTAYVTTLLIYSVARYWQRQWLTTTTTAVSSPTWSCPKWEVWLRTVVGFGTIIVVVGLHVLEVVNPPFLQKMQQERYPDLYPVLWSIAGCGMFIVAWATTVRHLYREISDDAASSPRPKVD